MCGFCVFFCLFWPCLQRGSWYIVGSFRNQTLCFVLEKGTLGGFLDADEHLYKRLVSVRPYVRPERSNSKLGCQRICFFLGENCIFLAFLQILRCLNDHSNGIKCVTCYLCASDQSHEFIDTNIWGFFIHLFFNLGYFFDKKYSGIEPISLRSRRFGHFL